MITSPTSHQWQFSRKGGLNQVSLVKGEDILRLKELDPKLWVALSCPVKGLEFDERTLALMDSDKDGRVRRSELLNTVALLEKHLVSLDPVVHGEDSLRIGDLRTDHAEGKLAVESLKVLLNQFGRPSDGSVSFSDFNYTDPARMPFAGTKLNGDGVITPASTDDASLAAIVSDILATQGGVPDRSGLPGVNKDKIDAFFKDLPVMASWAEKGKDNPLFALGTDLAAVKALRTGIDEKYAKGLVSEADWKETIGRVAAHEAWIAAKPGLKISGIGPGRARDILNADGEKRVRELLAADLAKADEAKYIEVIEVLTRLRRDFGRLLRNFVNFSDFYDKDKTAIFQPGRLFMDARECILCVRVTDPAKHAAMANLAECYLTYCDVSRVDAKEGSQKMQIAAVFSQGDSDFLMVGRNGLFIDNLGRDWDATIVKIVANPISIREAFWSPYKKLVRFIEDKVLKKAAASEAAVTDSMEKAADATTSGAPAAAKPAAPKEEKKVDLGTIALISTVIGGLVTAFGVIMSRWFDMGRYMPLGAIGLMLAISGPSMLIAAMKLRRRSLGPILDANGWALNGRVIVNIPLGTSMTKMAELPENARLEISDLYSQKDSKAPRRLLILAGILYLVWLPWTENLFNREFVPGFLWHGGKTSAQLKQEEVDKAKVEADKAKAEADKAKTEADKAAAAAK